MRKACLLAGLALIFGLPAPVDAAGLKQIGMIALPVPSNQFNSSSIDSAGERYFLPDRTNKALLVIDLEREKFALSIPGFVGVTKDAATNGPNSATVVAPNDIWVSDGDSSIKIVDLAARKVIDTVRTGGAKRVNEIAYDPKDKVLLAENPDDSPPFLTLFSTAPGRKIIAKIPVPEATAALERIVYYPSTDKFYVDVPAIAGPLGRGALAEIDPIGAKLVALHPVNDCNPHGLSAVSGTLLVIGCGAGAENPHPALHVAVYDTRTNRVTAYIPGVVGAGETAVGLAAGQYYIAANNDPMGPTLGVVDAKTNTLLQRIPTWTGSHTVAVNPKNGHVLLATRANSGPCGGCILIFAPE